MSINWVMLSSSGDFVRLPSETILHVSPPRVSISIDSISKYPGHGPYHLAANAGKLYLTNKRLVYLVTNPPTTNTTTSPTSPTPSTTTNPLNLSTDTPSFTPSSTTPVTPSTRPIPTTLTTFSALHAQLHDSHVTAPWFGPNAFVLLARPSRDGGIPSHLPGVEVRFTFKEGGAYDFSNKYVEVRERLAQVREMMREVGEGEGVNGGAAPEVHLEQLPAYSPTSPTDGINGGGGMMANGLGGLREIAQPVAQRPGNRRRASSPPAGPPPPHEDHEEDAVPGYSSPPATSAAARPALPPPDEAPPGYEESQGQVREEVEEGFGRIRL